MPLGKIWNGRAYGTNAGNVFLKLDGEDDALTGTLRFNDLEVGIVVYSVAGSFAANNLMLEGNTETQIDGVEFGSLSFTGALRENGDLYGEWKTDIGSAGTFSLFPHDVSESDNERLTDQLHTARHLLGAIEINRAQIIELAQKMQTEFSNGSVVITVTADTEQSYYLNNFEISTPESIKRKALK